MAEGEDLYDDLYEDVGDMLLPKAPFQCFHEMQKLIDLSMLRQNDSRGEEFKKKEAELNDKVELLQKEVEALKQDNAVLTRNISCLFKTAQMELARKDKQMKELRDENLRFKLGGTRGPSNVRPHLKKAVPVDKSNERGLMTTEKNHQNSTTVGIHDSQSSDEPIGEQNNRGAVSLESARLSSRIHEPDSDGDRQSSGEGKRTRSPRRGLLKSCEQRDTNRDGSRRTADDSFNNQRSFSSEKDSRSDRPRDGRFDNDVRHADRGHTKYRSPERNRDSGHDRSRDRRVNGGLRNSGNRKRHRSVSTERDVRAEDRESSRGAKAINRSESESARGRQKDHLNR